MAASSCRDRLWQLVTEKPGKLKKLAAMGRSYKNWGEAIDWTMDIAATP